MEKQHIPVLLSEVLAGLQPKPNESYLDLTAGYGGHASEILDVTQNYKDSVLVDRDEFAVNYLKQEFSPKIKILRKDFCPCPETRLKQTMCTEIPVFQR